MESAPQAEDTNIKVNENLSREEKTFSEYMKDFSLTDEDLQKSILDVGAGDGSFIRYVRNKLRNKHAFGVEKNTKKENVESDGMVFANGFEMPFADNTFEVVVSRNFLPMFTHDIGANIVLYHELIRVLKPGGKLIGNISTPESEIEESNQEIYRDDLKFKDFFNKRYKGAVELENHLKGLKMLGYSVEYRKSGDKDIIVITKP